MPGVLRCGIHKQYFGKVATTMPNTSCMQCWRIHVEEMNHLLVRFGWKSTVTFETVQKEDQAVHGAGSQGMLVEHDPNAEMTEQVVADPLDDVPPITEVEEPIEVPAGSIPLEDLDMGPGEIVHPVPGPEIVVPAPMEVPAPVGGEVLTPADGNSRNIPLPTEIPVVLPDVIGGSDGTTPGQNKQVDPERPAPGPDPFPQTEPTPTEPETPPLDQKEETSQLDPSVESVIDSLLRGDG